MKYVFRFRISFWCRYTTLFMFVFLLFCFLFHLLATIYLSAICVWDKYHEQIVSNRPIESDIRFDSGRLS